MKIRRLAAIAAFVGMLATTGSNPAQAQDSYEGNINSCADLGADYVDASGLVTVTANDGTYLSYTSTVAVTAVIKGGDNYNVYASATSGTGLYSPLNGGGNVPEISHYLFCYVPGDEVPVDEEPTCATDPSLCPVDEEPTCETDPSLCPVDEEPTCATDPSLCEPEPVCDVVYSYSYVVNSSTVGGQTTVSIDINAVGTPGDSQLYGMASYVTASATYDANETQALHDSDSGSIVIDQHCVGALTLDVTLPSCFYQWDAFTGEVLATVGPPNNYYGNRKLAWENGGTACEPEPTCETDPSLCEEPVDEEPTCATDPSLCEEPVDEEPTDEEPGTCPGGTDGYPECNPQIDAEVNLSVDCVTLNQDGTYTVGGVFSVTNQAEHDQDIRITQVVGPTLDSETFFLGQEILNGETLSYEFQSLWSAGDDPDAQFAISVSVLFESVQGRGTVREPRGDVEEFYLDAKGSCVGEVPVDEEPVDEEPVDEEPVDEEPVDEEPVDEEPVDEEPVDEQPVDEQSTDEQPETNGLGEQVVALPKAGSGPLQNSDSPMGPIAVLIASLLTISALGMRAKRQS